MVLTTLFKTLCKVRIYMLASWLKQCIVKNWVETIALILITACVWNILLVLVLLQDRTPFKCIPRVGVFQNHWTLCNVGICTVFHISQTKLKPNIYTIVGTTQLCVICLQHILAHLGHYHWVHYGNIEGFMYDYKSSTVEFLSSSNHGTGWLLHYQVLWVTEWDIY
jgi:hypothetical protein